MPLPETTKTIDLSAVGAPEFSVTFLRIPGMKYKDMLKLFSDDKNLDDSQRMKRRFKELILDWNILDKDGSRVCLPKEDPDIAFELPSIFIEHITTEMLKDATENVNLDLAKRNETS